MKIKNWDRWQTYRKDRGTPPWVKVHRNLMTNQDWAMLSDSEKGQLVCLWIIGADKNGQIPDDPKILQKMAALDEPPNINKFIELGFLERDGCHGDAKLTPSRQPNDAPETETETETETERSAPLRGIALRVYEDQLAGFVDRELFADLVEHRKKVKAGGSDRAFTLLANKLVDAHKKNINPNRLIEKTIERGWKTVFLPDEDIAPQPMRKFRES